MTMPHLMNCNHMGDGWCLDCVKKLWDELDTLQIAVRKHRDYHGDDKCFHDDEELYQSLPEGYTPPIREVAVELEYCKKFIQYRQNPKTEYISPQRRIEELEEENLLLKAQLKMPPNSKLLELAHDNLPALEWFDETSPFEEVENK